MNSSDYTQLSKTVSHALRHEPQFYNLQLDTQGWTLLSDLVEALRSKGVEVDVSKIIKMVELSEKKRHQVLGNRIRAYYGHSIENKIFRSPSKPPEFLYHVVPSTGDVNISGVNFIQGPKYVTRTIVHETAHYYKSITWSSGPGSTPTGFRTEGVAAMGGSRAWNHWLL